MWSLGAIRIYPIKSLPGVAVESAVVQPGGGLQGDREVALYDEWGKLWNAKRTPLIHHLAAAWDWPAGTVRFTDRRSGQSASFDWFRQRRAMVGWLQECFGLPLGYRDRDLGIPDDDLATGPTIVSQASWELVHEWFPQLSVAELQGRFRANLDLIGMQPFEEDRLFGRAGEPVRFRIGEAEFAGHNPCQRCVVPTRSTLDGTVSPGFQKDFSRQREATLPSWSERSQFNHFYRFSVNTLVLNSQSATIRVGDVVSLCDV